MATKQTQRSSFVDLPNEMVSEILLRLPSKSLLRCRAVCKAWRNLATDRGFLLAHHHRQPHQPLLLAFFGDADEDDESVLHYCLEAVDLRTDKHRVVVRFTDVEYDDDHLGDGVFDVLEVHASCDGLLLLSFLDAFFVCNPATRQATPLPPLRAREIAGLYPHTASGEYRVLYHRDEGLERKYYVLTVGSQQARTIERRASSASVGEGLARGVGRACTLPPVLLHGSLHWPPQQRQEDNILVFDTAAESFRWISPPVTRTDTSLFEYMLLFEMHGKLAMSCCKRNVWKADIWLMQDYKEDIWVCKYRIELSAIHPGARLSWNTVIVSQEGHMLVEGLESVLHYDINGKLLGIFDYDDHIFEITPHVLKESLVPHAFLQTQQHGSAGEPPFFLGL